MRLRVKRIAVTGPSRSAWATARASGDEGALFQVCALRAASWPHFFQMTSLNEMAFANLLNKLRPLYAAHTFQARRDRGSGQVSVRAITTVHGGGRTRSVPADACRA